MFKFVIVVPDEEYSTISPLLNPWLLKLIVFVIVDIPGGETCNLLL